MEAQEIVGQAERAELETDSQSDAEETRTDAEATQYRGVRAGNGWLSRYDMTRTEAEELIERRLHGANQERSYWLEEEGDHLVADFFDRNQPRSSSYPGNNGISKDGMWGSMRSSVHSDKRKEYPNRK
jgi:hypothetical protein